MNKTEIKTWIKEHKKEIVIGAVATAGVVALGYIGVKISKKKVVIKDLNLDIDDFFIPASNDIGVEFDCATVTESWDDGMINLILSDFRPGDIGELGKELVEKLGISENQVLTCHYYW